MSHTRIDHDPLGAVAVPAGALWGVHFQRATENFAISGISISTHRHLVCDGERDHALLRYLADAVNHSGQGQSGCDVTNARKISDLSPNLRDTCRVGRLNADDKVQLPRHDIALHHLCNIAQCGDNPSPPHPIYPIDKESSSSRRRG